MLVVRRSGPVMRARCFPLPGPPATTRVASRRCCTAAVTTVARRVMSRRCAPTTRFACAAVAPSTPPGAVSGLAARRRPRRPFSLLRRRFVWHRVVLELGIRKCGLPLRMRRMWSAPGVMWCRLATRVRLAVALVPRISPRRLGRCPHRRRRPRGGPGSIPPSGWTCAISCRHRAWFSSRLIWTVP
jgi:hypothetical protein